MLWLITGFHLRFIWAALEVRGAWDSRAVLRVSSQGTVSSSLSGGMVASLGYGLQGKMCSSVAEDREKGLQQ